MTLSGKMRLSREIRTQLKSDGLDVAFNIELLLDLKFQVSLFFRSLAEMDLMVCSFLVVIVLYAFKLASLTFSAL